MTTASLRRPIYGPHGRKITSPGFARRSLLREVSVDAEVRPYESLRAGDIRFAYHRTGMSGLPIILLHGWPQDIACLAPCGAASKFRMRHRDSRSVGALATRPSPTPIHARARLSKKPIHARARLSKKRRS